MAKVWPIKVESGLQIHGADPVSQNISEHNKLSLVTNLSTYTKK